jgi:inorganic phosphate transporter, PiT family
MLILTFIIILVALVFDFLNGFHDAANSIATIVSTRVLTPQQAVLWAAFFNFIAAFVFGTKVAGTIGKDLIDPKIVDIYVVAAGLLGAIVWDIITWLLGLPTSSSHALFGGLAGAAIARGGLGVLTWQGWLHGWGGILLFIVLAPMIGFMLGAINIILVSWIFRKSTPNRMDGIFRRLQFCTSSLLSLSHGGNDAQKTMGIIVMLLASVGKENWAHWGQPNLPWVHHEYGWPVIVACSGAMALGTMQGGWRIVKTLGSSITRLTPVTATCAEAAAASTIMFATWRGIPISTTHAITGSILGVGATRSVRSVRWIWGERIVTAWVLTLPCAAFMSAIAYLVIHLIAQAFVH